MEDIQRTYVYDGTEVVRTGRVAKSAGARPGIKPHLSQILIEIRPLDKDIEWKTWVKQSELFEITDGAAYFKEFNTPQLLIESDEGEKNGC